MKLPSFLFGVLHFADFDLRDSKKNGYMSKAWVGKIHDFRKSNTLILKRNLRCFRGVEVGREEGGL